MIVVLIGSSDFTHYGPRFRYLPFSTDVDKRLKELDMGAIELIKQKKAKEFANYVYKTGATICGAKPIEILLNLLNDERAELKIYYTSKEMTNDINSVSYASIVFKRG